MLLVIVGAAVGVRIFSGAEEPSLEDYGPAPSFSLQNQLGDTVGLGDLRDRVWVANFVFTRCATVCPMLTAKFANLQRRLADVDRARFVSFSVDPAYDTPEVLARYASRFDADPTRWWFLTGPVTEVQRTVVKGFKIHMGEADLQADGGSRVDILHGEHFVLVDGAGRIRGYFRPDVERLEALEQAVRKLSDD